MSHNISTSPRSVVAATLAADRLGAGSIAQYVLTAATPLLVVAGVVTTGWAVTGIRSIPVAFAVLTIVLGLFSVGYLAMAQRITSAGALSAYITAGLGRPLGVAASLVALLAYNMLQVGLYGIAGVLASDLLGGGLAWWGYALIAWALVAVLGLLRIDLNGRVLAVLLTAEIVIVAVFVVVQIIHPAGGHVSFAAIDPAGLIAPGIGAALAIAMTGFVGIEQGAIYAEESRDPRRTVPAATYGALALMGVIYVGASWSTSSAVGPENVVQAAQEHGPDLLYVSVAPYLSGTVLTVGRWLFLSSVLAGLVAYHNAVARYTFALGRERVLPAWCARTSVRTGAPVAASLLQTLVGATVITVFAWQGWDPLVQLFFWGGTTGGLGVLLLITVTSIAVVVYFLHNPGDGFWRATVIPLLASILLGGVCLLTLTNYATLLGVDSASPWAWVFPSVYAAVALLGVLWALSLRVTRPDVYALIGRGATATSTPASSPASYAATVGGRR